MNNLPKMSSTVSTPELLSGNIGAKTINIKGDDGATFVPSVSTDGVISWTNDKDLPNPGPVNIKGEKGESGTTNYLELENKPQINGVELSGNKTGEELGLIPDLSNYATKDEIPVVPEALPNPNALTFTGAVNATYDGSSAVSVEIPSGGGGGSGTDISLGLTSAAVGQTIKVKAVDESGKPTEWEAADFTSGGGGSAHGWKTLAIVNGTNRFVTPTAYDSETGYFTLPNHGFSDKRKCKICISEDASVEEYKNFGIKLKSLGAMDSQQIVVVDENTFYILLNYSTKLSGDLGINIGLIRILEVIDKSIKFTGIGSPIGLRLTVVGICMVTNPYLSNDTFKKNINACDKANNLWMFAFGLYAGNMSENSFFEENKITWEIIKISDRKININGSAFLNYHNGTSGVNTVNTFSGVAITPSEHYDLSEIEYVNINPSTRTTFILEALY